MLASTVANFSGYIASIPDTENKSWVGRQIGGEEHSANEKSRHNKETIRSSELKQKTINFEVEVLLSYLQTYSIFGIVAVYFEIHVMDYICSSTRSGRQAGAAGSEW